MMAFPFAFATLGTTKKLSSDTENKIEAFVCQLYEPGTNLVEVGELRWRLFTKKQLEAEKLPPTQGALHQAIARAHYQTMVWNQDHVPNPQMPPATEYGWEAKGEQLAPVSHNTQSQCISHCSCPSQNLNCSEMCMCGADEELCGNVSKAHLLRIDNDDDEDGDPSI